MASPVISLVCGTYKRLDSLQRMVSSVRETIPQTIPFEIVIADNGSNDGTWEWLQSQEDIRALQMGSPVGAIRAFTEAAYQAKGEYILIATDDIHFPEFSIMNALAHLESTPLCGAVTFMHNKRRDGFKADYAPVLMPSGKKEAKPYAQISLVRKALGDSVGWWGGTHPIMSQGFTYGGDNFLSSGIWELGYTIDTVAGAINHEDVFEDAPRKMNESRHKQDSELFFSIYPHGGRVPLISPTPEDTERLRILFLMHYSPKHPTHRKEKCGIREAFQEYGLVYEYDYAGEHDKGVNVTESLRRLCEGFKPHLIFSQFHNPSNGISEETTRTLRNAAPRAVLLNWNGDVWTKNIDNSNTQNMLAPYDLLCFTNAQLAEIASQKYGMDSFYMPHYFEPVNAIDLSQPSYDVLFTGNGYSPERIALMQTMRAMPYKVGIYGQAKDIQLDGNTHYDWSITRGLYHNATIVISDQQFKDAKGYVSNRMWEILATGGGVCLQEHSPHLDEMTGLQAGVHYIEWQTLAEMRKKVDYYLAHPDKAKQIAKAAQDYVTQNHTCLHRVQAYFEAIQWLSKRDSLPKGIPSKTTLTA